MEIDGVINHSLALHIVQRKDLEKRLEECNKSIDLLNDLRVINNDEPLRAILSPFTNIRQLVASPTHILGFLQTMDEEDMLVFQGHHLDTIQLYLDLREHCAGS